MAAAMVDRKHAREVELAVECVAIADELERLHSLAVRRLATLRAEARQLAGSLDGVEV
jgi:hypothetical protein